jgi:hypothetical protein
VFLMLVSAVQVQAARPLPDTTSRICVWADQIVTQNEAQDRFVALNFVGSQKLTKRRIEALRNYNPGFIVLQYHKAYGVDVGYNIIEPDTWGPDVKSMLAFIAGHPEYGKEEDYYLHWNNIPDAIHRIAHYWSGQMEFHLADVSHAGFRDYVATETIRRSEMTGYDGTFFDVAYFPHHAYEPDYNPLVGAGGDGRMWYQYPPFSWTSLSSAATNWNNLAIPFWRYIHDRYNSGSGKYFAIANCDSMTTQWYPYDFLNEADGGLAEGWMTDGAESHKRLAGQDWILSASRMLRHLTGPGKILIAQPNASPHADLEMRKWWIANYLLLKNSRTYYYYDQGRDVAWWPEYEIDIGGFLSPPPDQLDRLLVSGTSSLYQRQYQNGLVLVNPGETDQKITLPRSYYLYTFSGGGSVVGDQMPAMALDHSMPLKRTLTIRPHDAVILRAAGGPSIREPR